MSAAKRGCLAIGAAVRHAYDGARGTIEAIDQKRRVYVVRFDDGVDLVPFADVRLARKESRS